MRRLLFISHPNVVVSREIPVPQWHLSTVGQQRMHAALAQPWIPEISAVYCSTEQKSIDSADILARHLLLNSHMNYLFYRRCIIEDDVASRKAS